MRPPDAARLVLLGAIWGSSFIFIKLALEGYTSLQIVAGRIAAGAVTLLLLVKLKGLEMPKDRRIWRSLVFMSVIANVIPFTLINIGTARVSSALASILNSTTPIFTALFTAWILSQERLRAVQIGGVALGFGGVAVIVGGGGGGSIWGQLAIVLASVCYGIGFVYARRALVGASCSPISLSAGQLSIGAIIMAPVALFDGLANTPDVTLAATIGVIWVGALGAGIAFVLYYRLISDIGATNASLATYLIPVFGTFLGWLVRDEQLGWNAVAGATLVIAGIALAQVRPRSAPEVEVAPST